MRLFLCATPSRRHKPRDLSGISGFRTRPWRSNLFAVSQIGGAATPRANLNAERAHRKSPDFDGATHGIFHWTHWTTPPPADYESRTIVSAAWPRLPPPGKHRVSRSTSCALRQSQDNDIQAARVVEEAGPEERKPEAKASSETADQGARAKNEAPLAVASAPRGEARSDAEAHAARRAFVPRQIAGRPIARPLSLVLSAREFLRTRFSRRPGSRELGCRPAALSRLPPVCTPTPSPD